ncbi:NmrA-like family protein [Aspergillus stella-maris]|uniref:NmrA-like family protein n=1 Tax=Aspergillus stella-maris TaxID=1810926 RepID=UPI003CCD5570
MTLTVGIAGITGKFARLLTTTLLAYPEIKIHGLARTPSKLPCSITSNPRITLTQGDAFNKAAITSFARGCAVLVCCYLGDENLMVTGQKILIDTCEELCIPRYIGSDWALEYTRLNLGELFPGDPMIKVKAYLETKEYVKGVHILIGGFMEPIFSPFFDTFDAKSCTFRFWGNGDEVLEGTTYGNAAEFTAAVVRDEDAKGVVKFLGGRATIREVAQSFEKVYGIKAKLESRGSLDDLYKTMHKRQEEKPEDVYSYLAMFFYYYWVNGRTFVGPKTDNERYPDVKPVSWEEYMRQWPLEKLPSSYSALNA